MGMYSLRSYRLTKDEYNYLLPVLRSKLSALGDNYYFCGDGDDLDDMLSRLRGVYDFYDEYNKIINYRCFVNNSLEPFRSLVASKKGPIL